uniref:Cytochrome P450 n=1 Tax=Ditylenchus dipsaci TaxID=166011 RepID=A0A915CNF3_9BILA
MLEVNTLLETIETDLSSTNGEAMKTTGYSLSPLINVAVGSVINQLVFGFRFIKESHNHFYAMNKVIDAHNRGLGHSITSVVLTLPWLRHFPLFSYYFDQFDIRLGQLYQYFDEQIRSTIERRKKEAQSNFVRDEEDTYFVDAFVKEIEQRKTLDQGQEDQYFNIKSLRGLCVDLFIAGQETSSNTLNFLVLYMMVFPEVQTKLQEELDRVIGDNEDGSKRICLADKSKLPYTNAVINETQRFCNLLPINLIHRTTKDVDCGGYRIAKGTKIVPMISSVLYDEKIFTEPQKFMPERFIENGQLKKCEELIPFRLANGSVWGITS